MDIEKNRDIFWIRGQQMTVHGPKLALVSANEVSLEHSQACSSMYCLLLTLCSRALRNSGDRDHRTCKVTDYQAPYGKGSSVPILQEESIRLINGLSVGSDRKRIIPGFPP